MSRLNSFRRFAKVVASRGLSFINAHPKLQRYISAIIRRLGLRPLARAISIRVQLDPGPRQYPYGFIPTDIAHLSPRARQIYADLTAVIKLHEKDNG